MAGALLAAAVVGWILCWPSAGAPVAGVSPVPIAGGDLIGRGDQGVERVAVATGGGDAASGAAPYAPLLDGEVAVTLRWADDGAPVAGHEVVGTDAPPDAQPRPLASATTDDGGHASMTLPPGAYVVMAVRGAGRPVRVLAGERTAVELRIVRAGVVQGRVIDEDDAPVEGAEVLDLQGGLSGGPRILGRSAADGTFHAALPDGGASVLARKPGHGASAAAFAPGIAQGVTHLELVLASATGAIRGVVVEETGRPIAGAQVELAALAPRAESYSQPGLRPKTRTAADGSFAFTDVPAGDGVCFATAPGRRPGTGAFTAQLGVTAEVRIVLAPGARVAGRVLDAAGRPAAGVQVVQSRSASAVQELTGAEGTFAIDVRPGPVEVAARSRTLGAATLRLLVGEGETRAVELRLAPAPVLEGRVVDEQGLPLPDHWVVVRSKDQGAWVPFPVQATDGDGRFRFVGCPAGPLDVKVRVDRVFQGPFLARADAVTAGGPPLLLVVREAARPSAFLSLRIEDPTRPDRPCELVLRDLASGDEELLIVATGRSLRIGPLAAGSYQLRHLLSWHPGRPILGFDLGPLTLAAGEERDLGTQVPAAPTALRLTLRRSDGTRVTRIPRLRLVPLAGGETIPAILVEHGDVYPFSFPPGRYRVEVDAWFDSDVASAEVELRAGETTPLTLDLPALRPVRVTLRLPEGRHPPPRAQGVLRAAGGEERSLTFGHGIARAGLKPGRYEVVVDASGCRGRAAFTVDDVRKAELRVDVPVQ